MNLIIDQGNTRVKLAVFSAEQLVHKSSIVLEELLEEVEALRQQFPELEHSLISTVGGFPKEVEGVLKEAMNLIYLSSSTPVPFTSNYATPETLGVDRIGLVSAAVLKYPDEPVLIIDIGTCITYDLVTQEAVHLGGSISPGVRMRYKAMNEFTAKLPLLSPVNDFSVIGNSTALSMHSGVLQAVLFEVEGYIATMRAEYPGLLVVVTGGDAHFLRDNLKSDIFAHSNFLLQGLNYILEYNLGTR